MAREKVKGFDSIEFIEGVRESAGPTYHTAADCKEKQEAKSSADNKAPTERDKPPIEAVYVPPDDELPSRYSELNMTSDEIEYITTYVVKNSFRKVNQNGNPIIIREKHLTMIRKILGLLNANGSMASYIDNVLTEHFKKFYPTIVDIYNKCPPQF